MGIYISQEKTLKLFAKVDVNSNGMMELEEFEDAIDQFKLDVAQDTLKKLNQTGEELVWVGVSALVFLSLLFIFIYIGISAFSKAENFNAIVNSILPLSVAIIASLPSLGIESSTDDVEDVVHEIINDLKITNK